MTTTHLESAALHLRTQIAVDDPSTDLPEHTAIRRLAADHYEHLIDDIPFTESDTTDPS